MLADRHDEGFTLIELLIAIVIIGIIAVPMGNVIIGYLHTTNATTGRLTESHDAQLTAAYFQQDVGSVGVRDYTDTTTPAGFKQSIEVAAAAGGGLYPCGTAGPALIRLAWDDFTTGPSTSPIQVRAAYVLQSVPGQSQLALHRVVCKGSASVASDTVLAHDVVSASVGCPSTTATCGHSGAALPLTVSLTLTIHDSNSGSAVNYVVVLTGQRRQT
jgi:prepilin-type N-terminal cleavage/methylation domain-containing protein